MRLLSFVVAAAAWSCSSATVPSAAHVLGVIAGYNDDDPRIELVVQGRTVNLTVMTYGNSCFSAADTDVRVSGLNAVVTPYDQDPECSDRALKQIEHVVAVQFTEPGTARILVRGINASTRTSSNMAGDTVTIERSVSIR
jgi:hypothetical protein